MDQELSLPLLPAEIFAEVEAFWISHFQPLRWAAESTHPNSLPEDLIAGLERDWMSAVLAAPQFAPWILPGRFFEGLVELMTTGVSCPPELINDERTRSAVASVYRLLWKLVRYHPATATPVLIDALFQCLTVRPAPAGDNRVFNASDVQQMAGLLLACLYLPERRDRLLAVLLGWLEGVADDCSGNYIVTAALAVGCLGCHAHTPAVREQLLRRTTDPRWQIQFPALWAVGRLGPGAVTESFLETFAVLLGRESGQVLPVLWRTVRRLGPAAVRRILTSLGRSLGSEDPAARNRALRGVWSLRADPSLLGSAALADLLDQILRLLRHPSISTRETACNAVEALGARAGSPQIRDALTFLIADDDLGVRFAARFALDGLELPVSE